MDSTRKRVLALASCNFMQISQLEETCRERVQECSMPAATAALRKGVDENEYVERQQNAPSTDNSVEREPSKPSQMF